MNRRTGERRYWSSPARKQVGQPWADQNDRTGRLVWATPKDERSDAELFGGLL